MPRLSYGTPTSIADPDAKSVNIMKVDLADGHAVYRRLVRPLDVDGNIRMGVWNLLGITPLTGTEDFIVAHYQPGTGAYISRITKCARIVWTFNDARFLYEGGHIPQTRNIGVDADGNVWFPGSIPFNASSIGLYQLNPDGEQIQFVSMTGRIEICLVVAGELLFVSSTISFSGSASLQLYDLEGNLQDESTANVFLNVYDATSSNSLYLDSSAGGNVAILLPSESVFNGSPFYYVDTADDSLHTAPPVRATDSITYAATGLGFEKRSWTPSGPPSTLLWRIDTLFGPEHLTITPQGVAAAGLRTQEVTISGQPKTGHLIHIDAAGNPLWVRKYVDPVISPDITLRGSCVLGDYLYSVGDQGLFTYGSDPED